MADITVTAAKVGLVYPEKAEVFDFIAAASITAGQTLYIDSNGKVNIADANGSGTLQFRGIALNAAGAGQAVSVLKKGHAFGFTVTSQSYDAALFLSNTAGSLADAAGATSINCGRVVSLPDSSLTKVVYIEADWLRTWS
jgi:hypothetical protein